MAIVYYQPLSARQPDSKKRRINQTPRNQKSPKKRTWKLRFIVPFIAVVGLLVYGFYPSEDSSLSDNETTEPKTQELGRLTTYSTTAPSSPWVIVNKKHEIAATYEPADLITTVLPRDDTVAVAEQQLTRETGNALARLFGAAQKAGHELILVSGYRSFGVQSNTYQNFVDSYGQSQADTFSARPGHSEHQTGLAVDVAPADKQCYIDVCFGNLPSGQWVANNAHKYGFVVRYTSDKELITGYTYEPWHLRYVGTELANDLRAKQLTLEEYFDVSGGDYGTE